MTPPAPSRHSQPALDGLDGLLPPAPRRRAPKPPARRPRATRTPALGRCPHCGRPVLTALIDHEGEASADPVHLPTASVQAARVLDRPLYRSAHLPHDPSPLDLAPHTRWDPDQPPGEWVLPAHQCGAPPLPCIPIPLSLPREQPTTPPY